MFGWQIQDCKRCAGCRRSSWQGECIVWLCSVKRALNRLLPCSREADLNMEVSAAEDSRFSSIYPATPHSQEAESAVICHTDTILVYAQKSAALLRSDGAIRFGEASRRPSGQTVDKD